MRCLIVIALCFVVANANWANKNRFQRLLNRYQQQYPFGDLWSDDSNSLYGSDDVDDYVDDYVDQIRRERLFERDQCPRDLDDILCQQGEHWGLTTDNEYQWETIGQLGTGRQYWGEEEEQIGGGLRHSPLVKEVTDANVKLACRLYKQSKDEKDDKNTVVSPLSVQLALAALNYGTRGNTKRQIGRVIAGRLQMQQRIQVFKALVRNLKGFQKLDYSTHSTKINPVTGIFVAQTTPAQQMFVQLIKQNLGASVKQCSFSHQPQQCRQIINQWVSQRTHHKINRIVPQDSITDNTKMILVNALEMKAKWGPQMRRHVTKEAKFYPLDTKKVKIVEVMETEGRFKYFEDELVKIVGVPTKGHELTLYAIVPKDKDGLSEVEKLHLQDSVQLKQLLDVADKRVRRVAVQLPKFQIKHKIDVRRTLRKQGVTDAFDPQRADFSVITGVSKVLQDELETEQTVTPFFRRNPFLNTEFDEYEPIIGDLESMTGGKRETKLHLNKFIHQSTIKITENGITASTGSQTEELEQELDQFEHIRSPYGARRGGWELDEPEMMFDEIIGGGGHGGLFSSHIFESTSGEKIVKANRAFAFVVKHNPTNQLVLVGRVIDAAQKKVNKVHQTINIVDQF